MSEETITTLICAGVLGLGLLWAFHQMLHAEDVRAREAEEHAADPTPEQVVLGIAERFADDPEQIAGDLAEIAERAWSAEFGMKIGHPGGSARERDRLVTDVLDRVVPDYTQRKREAA